MSLTSLQQNAIVEWTRGSNVRVVAVPGAGKSRVLIEACAEADSLCIILAYNRELCLETKEKICKLGMGDWVICMTFHGLATYCVEPTHDDFTLADVLDRLDANQIPNVRRLQHIGKILIDEAQDFRPSFLRLIHHLIEVDESTQFMAVGDPRQMLYDYHEDDAACLDYLEHPEHYFVSERPWSTVTLDETHRMTPEMTHVVNKMFGEHMRSSKPPCKPVEVYTISMWAAGTLLFQLLRDESWTECCVLVPKKKNNAPLAKAVNRLSRSGFRLFIHGVDGQDARIKRNKLTISTWHAAKGTQKRVCVVLGLTDDAAINPAFVALTRGEERLIIIQDERCPNKNLMRAIVDAPREIVTVDKTTESMLARLDALPAEVWSRQARSLICVDAYRPSGSGRWMNEMMNVARPDPIDAELDEEDEIIAGLLGDHEDVADVYRLACLMAAERECCKRVRRITEIRAPLRMKRESQDVAVKFGSHARFISPNIPDDVLLDAETRAKVHRISCQERIATEDWCFVACACRAWNSYHHMLRQLAPYDWMDGDRLQNGVDEIHAALQDASNVEFDVRLLHTHNDYTLHVRCDVSTDASAFMFVWQASITHSNRLEAAIIAALHASHVCCIVNLRNGEREFVEVQENHEALVDRLVASFER